MNSFIIIYFQYIKINFLRCIFIFSNYINISYKKILENNSREYFYFNRHLLVDHKFKKKVIRTHFENKIKEIKFDVNQKNLIFFGDMGIGNFIQHVEFFHYLKINTNLNITVLFSSKTRHEISIARNCNYIDKVIFLEKSKTDSEIIQSLYKLKSKYNILVFKFSNSSIIPLIIIMLNPDVVIGHSSGGFFKSKYQIYYDIGIPFDNLISESENSVNLAKSVSNISSKKNNNLISRKNNFKISYLYKLKSKYIVNHILKRQKFIIVSPFVAQEQKWKEWPLSNFFDVIDYYITKGYKIIIVGAQNDKLHIDNFFNLTSNNNIFNYCGMKLILLIELLKYCDFSLSNDSSLLHLSTISCNQHFSIIGPSDIIRSLPVKEHIKYIRNYCSCNIDTINNLETLQRVSNCSNRCILSISPTQVISKINSIIM